MDGPIRVLHVDDDPDLAALTEEALEDIHDGLEIETVHSPTAALDRIENGGYHCIVSDYEMPDLTGIDLLEQVREVHPDLPFILFTGKGSEEVAADALKAGATDYLQKEGGSSQFQVLANRIDNAVERYLAKQETVRSERHRREMLDRITDGYAHLDESLDILYVNEATAEFAGIPRDELIGMNYRELVDEDASSAILEAYETVLESGEPLTIEERSDVHPDRWVEDRVFPADDGGIYVFFRDITEHKQREHELQTERDRLSAIYDAVPEPLVNTIYRDEAPIVKQVNKAFEEVFGIDSDEAIGSSINDLIVPPEYQEEAVGIDKQAESDGFVQAEVWRESKDGQRLFRFSAASVTSDADQTEWIGTYVDITDRKLREETLREQQENLEQLHEAANRLYTADSIEACYEVTIEAGVSVLGFDWCTLAAPSDDGRYLEIRAISAGTPLEVGDTPFGVDEGIAGEVYQSKEPSVVGDVRESSNAEPTADVIRSVLTVPVGDWGILQAISTDPNEFDEQDRHHAELLVASMLTAVDRIEQRGELERQRDRLEEFASVVSHDLRNPLAVADGRIDLAADECDSVHLEDAAAAIDRMDNMIDDLLTLASEGESVGERSEFELAQLLDDCRLGMDTKEATFICETDAVIRADRQRVRQLFENLIRNAIEHAGHDVTITVGHLEDGFFVADDGPGITLDDPRSIFEPGVTGASDGNGFGLAIVKRIVDAHEWEISVTTGEGGGARFEITDVDIVTGSPEEAST